MNYTNDKKILRNSYVPTRPKFYNKDNKGNLDTRLQQETYNEIISNPDKYFEKTTITNFLFDTLSLQRRQTDTRQKILRNFIEKKVDFEFNNELHKDVFLSSAQIYEHKDVYFENDLQKDCFN